MDHEETVRSARAEQDKAALALRDLTMATYDAIRDAAPHVRHMDLVRAAGFTREHVRRIVNSDHGSIPKRSD